MVDVKCVFSSQDVVTSAVFTLCLLAGAAANADYSSDNANTYDDKMCDKDNTAGVMEDICNDLRTVANAEGATAVSFSVIHNCTVQLCSEIIQCNVSCHACFLNQARAGLAGACLVS